MSKSSEKEKKSLVNVIFIILIVICLILLIIYVVSPKYRKSVNKDISSILKIDMDEKTKFLDNLFNKKKKTYEQDESNNKVDEDSKDKKELSLKEEQINNENKDEALNKENDKDSTEKNIKKEEVVKEKTPSEKALALINEKYNKDGIYMTYIMEERVNNIFVIAISDPETTNLKGAFVVNPQNGSIEELK